MTRDAQSPIELKDVDSQKPKTGQLSPATSLQDQEAAPYSVFSKKERWMIAILIGFTMLFSPLSANIYFPAINQLQEALHTGAQNINLTITTYLIFQAVAPALFGDVADTIGRRPVFIVMFTIYIIANLALALQTSFAAMLVLRMLQSLGCSATVAISYGVVADVSTPAQRGSMLGFAMIATNLGPALAPVIGGVLVDKAGWRWIFWFLLICGAFVLILIILLLPETARHIVGNGYILPRKWRRPSISLITNFSIPREAKVCVSGSGSQEQRPLRIPNPLRSLRILIYRDAGAITLMSGIFYLIYYCIQASIARIFKDLYGLNDTLVGVSYLAIGVGVVLGGVFNGKLMDWNYKQTARRIGHTIDKVKGDDLTKFPIETARLRSMVYLIIANSGILAGYGWTLQRGAVGFSLLGMNDT